jgi:hypothetical protein
MLGVHLDAHIMGKLSTNLITHKTRFDPMLGIGGYEFLMQNCSYIMLRFESCTSPPYRQIWGQDIYFRFLAWRLYRSSPRGHVSVASVYTSSQL